MFLTDNQTGWNTTYLPTCQLLNVQNPHKQVGCLHLVSTFSALQPFSILPCCWHPHYVDLPTLYPHESHRKASYVVDLFVAYHQHNTREQVSMEPQSVPGQHLIDRMTASRNKRSVVGIATVQKLFSCTHVVDISSMFCLDCTIGEDRQQFL